MVEDLSPLGKKEGGSVFTHCAHHQSVTGCANTAVALIFSLSDIGKGTEGRVFVFSGSPQMVVVGEDDSSTSGIGEGLEGKRQYRRCSQSCH